MAAHLGPVLALGIVTLAPVGVPRFPRLTPDPWRLATRWKNRGAAKTRPSIQSRMPPCPGSGRPCPSLPQGARKPGYGAEDSRIATRSPISRSSRSRSRRYPVLTKSVATKRSVAPRVAPPHFARSTQDGQRVPHLSLIVSPAWPHSLEDGAIARRAGRRCRRSAARRARHQGDPRLQRDTRDGPDAPAVAGIPTRCGPKSTAGTAGSARGGGP
jgi:hypothetical protein